MSRINFDKACADLSVDYNKGLEQEQEIAAYLAAHDLSLTAQATFIRALIGHDPVRVEQDWQSCLDLVAPVLVEGYRHAAVMPG